MSEEKKTIVRRPYRGEYRETLEIDDDKETEAEIQVSDSDKPSEDTATSAENLSEETVETKESDETEDTETAETTSNASPVEPEAKVWKKRYDDARRHHNKLIDRTKQLELQLKAKGDISLPKTKEEIDEWRSKYPDVYDIVSSISAQAADERTSKLKKQIEEVAVGQEEVVFERAYNNIVKVHPDFDELIANAAFHTWAETQPKSIQSALYENRSDSAAAIRAIDLYKYDNKGKTKAAPKKDAATAVTKTKTSETPDSKEPKIWKESEIQALSAAEYDQLEAEIDLAAREGRVLLAQ